MWTQLSCSTWDDGVLASIKTELVSTCSTQLTSTHTGLPSIPSACSPVTFHWFEVMTMWWDPLPPAMSKSFWDWWDFFIWACSVCPASCGGYKVSFHSLFLVSINLFFSCLNLFYLELLLLIFFSLRFYPTFQLWFSLTLGTDRSWPCACLSTPTPVHFTHVLTVQRLSCPECQILSSNFILLHVSALSYHWILLSILLVFSLFCINVIKYSRAGLYKEERFIWFKALVCRKLKQYSAPVS